VRFDETERTYYWYGENKEFTTPGSRVWTYGIRCYSSSDLYNWRDRGLIIPPVLDDPVSPLHPTQLLDRPHIIHNAATAKWVAWIKVMGRHQCLTVLTADEFLGPYDVVRPAYHPLGLDSGDFDLHVDEATGAAYIWFARPHGELICATLTDDFTAVTGEFSAHLQGLRPPYTREAPTHFVREGRHYLLTSGTTGYLPNRSLVTTFKDYHGEYRNLGDPHGTDATRTSFLSQLTDVVQAPDRTLVAVADRWLPGVPARRARAVGRLARLLGPFVGSSRRRSSELGELEPRNGRRRRNLDATHDASYVWLPIEWQGEMPAIRWHGSWALSTS
jgi:hypothetical protein